MSGTSDLRPKSTRFRREREASWRRLEGLVGRIETRGVKSLTPQELAHLPALYGIALSSLGVARSISLDRNLVEYLESLTTRAHFCVYAPRKRPMTAILHFLREGFPEAVRAHAPYVLVAATVLLLGILAGFGIVSHDMDQYDSLMPSEMAGGRHPGASTEELLEPLYGGAGETDSELAVFATYLFTHNTSVGVLCFTLGFAAGLPVFYLLLYNGLLLGAMAALYHSRGLGAEFWAWVLPHGGMELTAIVLCGAGGLALGRAVVFPGRHQRLVEMARTGKSACLLMAGGGVLLLGAGLIEGFFRQRVHDPGARAITALMLAALLLVYFLRAGRKP